ncbi:KilA-N domain-containing protein [bacterium]|nr:KilA-N domain-containing protein [bacterium]
MTKRNQIIIQDTPITIIKKQNDDYISLADIVRSQLREHIIFRWLSLKNTLIYLGEWEKLYNPNLNCTDFSTIKNHAGCKHSPSPTYHRFSFLL